MLTAESIHEGDQVLEDLIEAGYQATQNPDCLAGDHSWQPAGPRIRCARCKWSPHVPDYRHEPEGA